MRPAAIRGKSDMFNGHLAREMKLVRPRCPVTQFQSGRFRRKTVIRSLKSAGLAVLLSAAFAGPALAQNYADELTPTPVIEPAGQRYILMVLDQPDRDLVHGR